MSCPDSCCGCPQCSEPACDPNHEPLASALDNFITAFFGSVTKVCVNNEVEWVLPCNLADGMPGYPRIAGEGVACYFIRIMKSGFVGPQGPAGATGPQGPAGPVGTASGWTGNVQVVESVSYNTTTHQLVYNYRTLNFANGLLGNVTSLSSGVAATAEGC